MSNFVEEFVKDQVADAAKDMVKKALGGDKTEEKKDGGLNVADVLSGGASVGKILDSVCGGEKETGGGGMDVLKQIKGILD